MLGAVPGAHHSTIESLNVQVSLDHLYNLILDMKLFPSLIVYMATVVLPA
jgi:hypothetical protein